MEHDPFCWGVLCTLVALLGATIRNGYLLRWAAASFARSVADELSKMDHLTSGAGRTRKAGLGGDQARPDHNHE